MDDDEFVIKAIARLLLACGFHTETFDSGRAFLATLHEHVPDCVLLDLHMLGFTGWEVQAEMAASGFRIPIIFITADGNPAARERIAAEGAMALLRKPFTEQELLRAIEAAMVQ